MTSRLSGRNRGLLEHASARALLAVFGAASAMTSAANAQCAPELDAQSGASGAPLVVTCGGTDTDRQGDGTNQFVNLTVNGAITTTGSTVFPEAIWLRSNNVVVVNGQVSGSYAVRLGDFSSTPVVGNTVTAANGGRIDSTFVPAVFFFAAGDVLSNTANVNGAVSGFSIDTFGRAAQNAVTVGATGRIFIPSGQFFDAALGIFGTGVQNNAVSVSGVVDATDANPSALSRGVELSNSGTGTLDNNSVTVAVGGSVTGRGAGVRLRSEDFNNEGSIFPAGDVFLNAVTVNGSVSSLQGDGVDVSNAGATATSALVRDNRVTVAGSINAPQGVGVRFSGRGVRNNVVDVGGTVTTSASPGLYFENTGPSDFSGNTATLRAGSTVSSAAQAIYFFSSPVTGTVPLIGAADIRANTIAVNGNALSTNNRAVLLLSNAALRDNILNVGGLARSDADHAVQFLAVGAVSGNAVNVAAGGRIQASAANRIGLQFASVGSGLVSGNTVDNAGTIAGATAVSFGPGSGNRLINRSTGAINGDVIFTSTASEIVLFAGSTLNGNVGGAGAATATLQGPGQATLELGRFSNMSALNVAGGRWTATGSGAGFSSATIAAGAELVLNGSLVRPLTIAPGGVLSGVGTVGPLFVGGGLAPGNSIGTTNVVGPLTFAPSSVYAVEVGGCPGACADRVIATGPVTINGGTVALSVFGAPGPLAGRVPIVTGSSVSGTFTALSAPPGAFSTAFLDYTPTDVFLNFSLGPSLTGATHAAATPVGGYGVTLLTRSLLSPGDEEAGRLPGGGGCALYVFSDGSPTQRVEGAPQPEKGAVTRAWARGLGAKGQIDADHGLSDTRYHLGAFAVGVERSGGGVSIGFGVGTMQTRIRSGGHALSFDSALMMAYAGYESGPFSLGLAGAAARHSVDSAREVAPSDVARGAFSGWTWGLAAEAGYGFKSTAFEATPFVGVDYTRTTFGAFFESGASFANLSVPRREGDALRASVGARFTTDTRLFGVFKPGLRLAYAREFLTDGVFSARYATTPSSSFSVDGAELGRDRLLVGAGVAMKVGERGSLSLSYDGEFSKNDRVQGGTARFAVAF